MQSEVRVLGHRQTPLTNDRYGVIFVIELVFVVDVWKKLSLKKVSQLFKNSIKLN